MNIFSNVGITELVLILLLALLVVGPERLPELARQLGKVLHDVRKMYENLTSDLGPELMSLQESTRDLRESVESVRSIPKDMVQQVVQAAELDEAVGELRSVKDSVDQMGKSLSDAKSVVQDPLTAAVDSVRGSPAPDESAAKGQGAETETQEEAASIAEEPQPQTQEIGEESQVEAEGRAAGGEAPAVQQAADEEPAPNRQAVAEDGAVEQDHE
jgi:sec-independent protein translocase protein TatB